MKVDLPVCKVELPRSFGRLMHAGKAGLNPLVLQGPYSQERHDAKNCE